MSPSTQASIDEGKESESGPIGSSMASSSSNMSVSLPPPISPEEIMVYLDLWEEFSPDSLEPRNEANEVSLRSGPILQSDSWLALCKYCDSLGIPRYSHTRESIFSTLRAAIDEQSWPWIPHMKEAQLLYSDRFPCQPGILLDSTLVSYRFDKPTASLKLMTLRGIISIETLDNGHGIVDMDPNIRHRLHCLKSGNTRRRILNASFARRKANESMAQGYFVVGLRIGTMKTMGFIFCRDPENPNSGPVGHIMITCSPNMRDNASNKITTFDENTEDDSNGTTSKTAKDQGPAIRLTAWCPYCSSGYTSLPSLKSHLKNYASENHSNVKGGKDLRDEIRDFLSNCKVPQKRPRVPKQNS